MTRKDKFLRALQRVEPRPQIDATLVFRFALNLSERGIPPDLILAARQFAHGVTGGHRGKFSPRENPI